MARLRYTDYCRHDRDAARPAEPLCLAFARLPAASRHHLIFRV